MHGQPLAPRVAVIPPSGQLNTALLAHSSLLGSYLAALPAMPHWYK